MSYQRTFDQPDATTQPGCIHLRSKAMYVTGDFDPTHLDEDGSHYCWCNLTQHVIGPDEAAVGRARCVPGRDCYRDCR